VAKVLNIKNGPVEMWFKKEFHRLTSHTDGAVIFQPRLTPTPVNPQCWRDG
jgi:hypothetical protein